MARVILMCGKICSGKSTYAARLGRQLPAAVLSADEIMLSLFGQDAGEKHDEYYERLEKYLFAKAAELAGAGISVILDIGLWTKRERGEARDYFSSRGIASEIHYTVISDGEWKRRIEKRNKMISDGEVSAYYVDAGLLEKMNAVFETPQDGEADILIKGAE